ncbi:ubiquitin-specific protease ubp1 [Amphichorda felina]
MSPRQSDFGDLYLDRLGSTRQTVYPSQTLWDRLNQPTVIISVLVVLISVLYNLHSSSATFEEVLSTLEVYLWDALVYATPSPLLYTLDNWLHPQQLSSSEQMVGSQPSSHASKSAAMRRVLGMNSGRGMVASVFQARTRALSMTSSALGFKVDTDRPAGLGNRDNSCFQNSILQGLASLDKLPDYLSACLRNTHSVDNDANKVVTQTLRTLLSDLNDVSNNGTTLWTPNKLKFLSTWTQQDAQEYYSKILDDIDKGAAEALNATRCRIGFESDSVKDDATASQPSVDSGYQSLSRGSGTFDAGSFRNPLEGLLAQRVACVQCGHSDGLSMIPFNCLTLSLGLRGYHDLYERLDAYSHVESIEGVECPKCTLLKAQRLLTKLMEQMRARGSTEEQLAEPLRRLEAVELALEEDRFDEETIVDKCKISSQGKVTTTKTKQIVIARPPQSLAIHVNRSVFDPSTFNMIKNSAPVNFPMTLDLGPWCLGSADIVGQSETGAPNEEQWLQDPKASMIAGDSRPSRLSGPIYHLRAVVTHYGRHENGHYICYRRYPRTTSPDSRDTSTTSAPDSEVGDDVIEEQPDNTSTDGDVISDAGDEATEETDWWRLSDHNVSKVDEQTVSSLAPGVFMLFYDCIDPNMVLQDSSEFARSAAAQSASASVNGEVEKSQKSQPAQPPSQPLAVSQSAGKEQRPVNHQTGDSDSPAKSPESVPLPLAGQDKEVLEGEERDSGAGKG